VLKTLFDKKLITTAGKKPVVGTPFLYKTTKEFLIRFGLNDLAELPKPEEIDEDLAAADEGDLAPLALVPRISEDVSIAAPEAEPAPGEEASSPNSPTSRP
jgi:segregation and condensation protein B